ncbi:MAG: RHS repeat-associated core domain-containing protein [Anaerolineales bacterium]|nr:RHS repeat-associated core domain-containing protein [Anaerolineales bacterium]
MTDDQVYYVHSDHLGSVSVLTQLSDGYVVNDSKAYYLPFGDWRRQPTSDLSDLGYTGHRHNNVGSSDIGLIYMNARYYVPEIGRFASADPIPPALSAPQTLNRYAYVLNNPLNLTDPTGHCATKTIDTPQGIFVSSNGDDACWNEWQSLIDAGAPQSIVGSGADYVMRTDIDIILALHEQHAVPWDILLGNEWTVPEGAYEDNDYGSNCSTINCHWYGYNLLTLENDAGRYEAVQAKTAAGSFENVYILWVNYLHARDGWISQRALVSETASQSFRDHIDKARGHHEIAMLMSAGGYFGTQLSAATLAASAINPLAAIAAVGAATGTAIKAGIEVNKQLSAEWDAIQEFNRLTTIGQFTTNSTATALWVYPGQGLGNR